MITILLTMLAASGDTSAPHREINFPVTSAQSRDDLTLCIARKVGGAPIALTNKTVIDQPAGGLVTNGPSYFSITIDDAGSERVITGVYRKPFTARVAYASMRSVAKACFTSEFNAALVTHPVEGLKPIQS